MVVTETVRKDGLTQTPRRGWCGRQKKLGLGLGQGWEQTGLGLGKKVCVSLPKAKKRERKWVMNQLNLRKTDTCGAGELVE